MAEKALSLYVHIPYCISKCSYCDFFSRGGCKNVPQEYVEALCKEISFRAHLHSDFSEWKSVYIGGGTPSLLSEAQLLKICDEIAAAKKISCKTEFTIELNPDDVNPDFINALNQLPVNRISVGIQSLNENSLSFAKRRANTSQNIYSMECISKYWNKGFSVDLICGLPYETKETFMQGLEVVIRFKPDHISMYSLTFEDETPFGKMLKKELSDYDFDFADDLWLKGREFLKEKGYGQYEVSNFCKKGFESVHNLSYWTQKDYLGCGSGATGTFYDGSCALRITATNDIEKYCNCWKNEPQKIATRGSELEKFSEKTCRRLMAEHNFFSDCYNVENIDEKTLMFEFFMMGLRKLAGVKESDFIKCFSKKMPVSVKQLAKKWEERGLCTINEADGDFSFTLGESGILFLNSFAVELDLLE